ncbi:MAG: RNA 2',3'-cyclic phosphodiesterase [Chloroflexi bacterium]|nr:RNA 2',3'-cyclic phosphodiesterase [Chloroflexota bacterium]
MQQIRTFVAVELDSAIKSALQQVQSQLKRSQVAHIGRWVSPDSIHLTLKFLGDVHVGRVEEIKQALAQASRCCGPFSISLFGAGCFPNARRLRVLWVGVGGDLQMLTRLQAAVDAELNRLGFRSEQRGFQPHLTVGRIRDNASPQEREEMGRLITRVQVDTTTSMVVHKVSFIRSDLRPSGPIYTPLAEIPLLAR